MAGTRARGQLSLQFADQPGHAGLSLTQGMLEWPACVCACVRLQAVQLPSGTFEQSQRESKWWLPNPLPGQKRHQHVSHLLCMVFMYSMARLHTS